MKLIKKSTPRGVLITFSFLITGFISFAQTGTPGQAAQPAQSQQTVKENFSDERLKKFVEVYKKLAPQQQQAEAKMLTAIEQQGLTPQRFNQLAENTQKNSSSATASAEEMKKFNAAAQQIVAIQKDEQPRIEKAITDEGMKPEEFEQIVLAYHQNPAIQQRIQIIMKQP
jgi:urate oxidase